MRKKKQQRLIYDPEQAEISRPSQWKVKSYKRSRGVSVETESSSAPTKRQKMNENTEQRSMNSLQKTLIFRLKNEIEQAILNKKDVSLLKAEIQARSILPRGTFTAAKQDAGVKAS